MSTKKAQKKTPENRAEMARQGAQSRLGHLTPTEGGLKPALGLFFGVSPNSAALSADCNGLKKLHTLCAKRPFKGHLKHHLKKSAENVRRSLTYFLDYPKKGGFCHVKMV